MWYVYFIFFCHIPDQFLFSVLLMGSFVLVKSKLTVRFSYSKAHPGCVFLWFHVFSFHFLSGISSVIHLRHSLIAMILFLARSLWNLAALSQKCKFHVYNADFACFLCTSDTPNPFHWGELASGQVYKKNLLSFAEGYMGVQNAHFVYPLHTWNAFIFHWMQ